MNRRPLLALFGPFFGPLIGLVVGSLAGLSACSREEPAPPAQPLQVTAVSMTPRDTPVQFEFVAQTESSRAV
jgi:membrane fusion protein (multidrug efflux system)